MLWYWYWENSFNLFNAKLRQPEWAYSKLLPLVRSARAEHLVKSVELSNAFLKDLPIWWKYITIMVGFFRGCLHDSQIRDCKVSITKISSSGIDSSLYIRSWSSGAATFTSFSGDFAAYCSKTTINFKLTQALLHFITSIAVNTIKP